MKKKLVIVLTCIVISQHSYSQNKTWDNSKDYPSMTLFSDDFDSEELSSNWSSKGNSVIVEHGILKISTKETDNGGEIVSKSILVNNEYPITIFRRVHLMYANNQVNHVFSMIFGETPNFIPDGGWSKGVVVSYANYDYVSQHGLYIGDKWSSLPDKDLPGKINYPAPVKWDTWFNEALTYYPKSGKIVEEVDGSIVSSFYVKPLSRNQRYLRVYMSSYGWFTGHHQYVDRIQILQNREESFGIDDW